MNNSLLVKKSLSVARNKTHEATQSTAGDEFRVNLGEYSRPNDANLDHRAVNSRFEIMFRFRKKYRYEYKENRKVRTQRKNTIH
jgi:hypothetical protein